MLIKWAGSQYKFDGWYFEIHKFCGPMLLNKNSDPSARPPGKKFFAMWEKFNALPKSEQVKYRVWKSPHDSEEG